MIVEGSLKSVCGPNPSFKVTLSQYSLKGNISKTVHPIHYMFGSRIGFSRSVDRMEIFLVRSKLNTHTTRCIFRDCC